MARNVNKCMIKLLAHSSTVNRDPEFRHEAMVDDVLFSRPLYTRVLRRRPKQTWKDWILILEIRGCEG